MAYWNPETKELEEGPSIKEAKRLRTQMRNNKVPVPMSWKLGVHDADYEERKEEAKAIFLEEMSKENNITNACMVAHIGYNLYRSWLSSGFITEHEMNEALRRFKDRIRLQIVRLAIDGIPQVVIRHGQVTLDKKGKPVEVNMRDLKALILLAQRYLPEFKDEPKKEVDVHVDISGIPSRYLIALDGSQLDSTTVNTYVGTEIEVLRQIASTIELRKQQQDTAIESTLV